METFGSWLLGELEKRGMSQADLARACAITTAQMSRIISGARGAGKDTLAKIAHALHLPVETIFQAAGIYKATYDPNEDRDPTLLEWILLFKGADDAKREEMLRYVRYLSAQEEREKILEQAAKKALKNPK